MATGDSPLYKTRARLGGHLKGGVEDPPYKYTNYDDEEDEEEDEEE